MRKLYNIYLLLLLSTANTAHAITINFSDGSWQHYFELTVKAFNWDNDNLYINHVFTSDFPMYSRASYLSVATESGAISFDWEIWSSDSLFSQPTSVAYDAQFLGVPLFSGIVNSNDVYRGHAKVMISAGDRLAFTDFMETAPFPQNHNVDLGIRLYNVRSIPEPATAALISLGLAGLLGFKRSKKQRN